MSNFVVEFKLKIEKYQENILEKRFEIGRKIYNALANKVDKRYRELIKTKKYRGIKATLLECKDSKTRNESYKKLNALYKESNLNEYSFHSMVES